MSTGSNAEQAEMSIGLRNKRLVHNVRSRFFDVGPVPVYFRSTLVHNINPAREGELPAIANN